MRIEFRKSTCAQPIDQCPKAVLIVFFDRGAPFPKVTNAEDGSVVQITENQFLASFFSAFDDRLVADSAPEKKRVDFNLLTSALDFSQMWLYEDGSATTPPCLETRDAHAIPRQI